MHTDSLLYSHAVASSDDQSPVFASSVTIVEKIAAPLSVSSVVYSALRSSSWQLCLQQLLVSQTRR